MFDEVILFLQSLSRYLTGSAYFIYHSYLPSPSTNSFPSLPRKSVRLPNIPQPCKRGRRHLRLRVGSCGLKLPRSIPMASLSRPLIGIRWGACPRISKLELESLISRHLSCPDQMIQSSDLSNALRLLCKCPPPTPKLAQNLHVTCAAASSGSLFCGSVDDDRDAL